MGSLIANKVPTLVIYGGNDHPEGYANFRKIPSSAENAVIPGAGHAGAVQNPEFVKTFAPSFESINSLALTKPSEVDVKSQ